MYAYRIVSANYAKNLEASGRANRWNLAGELVVYAAASRALAILEMLAHRNAIMPTKTYKILQIEFANNLVHQVKNLPANWHNLSNMHKTQGIGSGWYKSKAKAILQVPSALVKNECNYIINTTHANFNNIHIVHSDNFIWDGRLL